MRAIDRFGGDQRTEDAVEAGLAWLAAHQERSGIWSRTAFDHRCPSGDRCPGPADRRLSPSLTPGLTGLCLLAFLGAGYTDRDGPYQDNVERAVAALLAMQQPDGGFSPDPAMAGYNNALATFALAEYYARTREERVLPPLSLAVLRLAQSQQGLGGWDYLPDGDRGRNDTSITGWAVQALQSAAAAGVDAPPSSLVRAVLHARRSAQRDGRVWYSDAGTGFDINRVTFKPQYRYGPAMTAVGLLLETLLGWRLDCPLVERQRTLLLRDRPDADRMQGGDPTQLHSYYYWYYGTVALFQLGGAAWDQWNAQLRDAILPLQNREKLDNGERRHVHGSWPPYANRWGKWGRMGGRVYTTALCVLTLEIYYRGTPAYLRDPSVLSLDNWRNFLQSASRFERRYAAAALADMRLELAEPLLDELVTDEDRATRVAAALALADLGSPLGRSVLAEAAETYPPTDRARYARVLMMLERQAQETPMSGTLRQFDVERGLATINLPGAYRMMIVDVMRDGAAIAAMRVVRRFSEHDVVVAELLTSASNDPPRAGDLIIEHREAQD